MSDDRVLVNLGAIPGNSHKEKRELEKSPMKKGRDDRAPMRTVLKNGKGLMKKDSNKGAISRLIKRFIDDDVDDLQSWFIDDILIPGLKNLFLDSVETIFGNGSRRKDGYYYTDYHARYRGRNYEKERSYKREDRDYAEKNKKIEYDNIVVTNKQEAEEIVTELRNRIRDYDYATISDLYQLIDMPSDYNDHDWGWTDPKAIGLKSVRGGYLIDVDRAVHID